MLFRSSFTCDCMMNYSQRTAFLALIGGITLPLLASSPSAAVVVSVGSVSYDVTYATISYQSNQQSFDTFANVGQMPWWGNETFASLIANEVFTSLGASWDADHGPVFAYGLDGSGASINGVIQSLSALSVQDDVTIDVATAKPFAIATVAAPAPFPVIGAFAAYGWAGNLRKRVTRSRHSICL